MRGKNSHLHIKRLGLIAGSDTLPVRLAEEAVSHGVEVISIVFSESMAQKLKPHSKVYFLGLGQVGKILKTLKNEGIQYVAFAGKVEKKQFYEKPRLDIRALLTIAKLKDRKDDTVMLAVIAELEKDGMTVVEQSLFLKNLLAKKGLLTGKQPTSNQIKDIKFGLKIAKEIAGLDIGQTVVVKDKAILAIEAIEGTDEAVKRGCALCRKGGVVVKVEKPGQDSRFDLPAVGPTTIRSMSENKGALLAIEAGKTLVVEKDEMIAAAKKAGITVVAV